LLNIFVDADACPVKSEVYRVAVKSRDSLPDSKGKIGQLSLDV